MFIILLSTYIVYMNVPLKEIIMIARYLNSFDYS